MLHAIRCTAVLALSTSLVAIASAECSIAETDKALDPIEVGFCRADAVFVGSVDTRMETIRSFREEGSERTKHFWTEISTLKVLKQFKGSAPAKVTMRSELYDKQAAFSFVREKDYLVFATRQSDDAFTAATAACSVQPTLLVNDAASVLRRLEQHADGSKRIDCANIARKPIAGS